MDIGLGYAANDLGTDKGSADQIIAGLGYTMGDLYFGATYTTGDKDDKADTEFTGIEVSAQYKITKEFRLIAAYQNQEEETKNVTKDTADFFELTGRYDFTKTSALTSLTKRTDWMTKTQATKSKTPSA